MSLIAKLSQIRMHKPEAFAKALRERPKADPARIDGNLMIIACDHPARGALGAGGGEQAMASREQLLDRCIQALSREGVDGFLGTADLIEDLALLGALDNKLVFGSMNRGGLQGAQFEIDDRFTGYNARGVVDANLDGGKMLLRVDYSDPASVRTLEHCAQAVDELARSRKVAMVEPFITHREGGSVKALLDAKSVITSITVASGLGSTSAYTWLKLPAVDDMERVMEATTLPALILGGAGKGNLDEDLVAWGKALQAPNVRGLVIGRSLLFPADGDVATAVDKTVQLLK